MQPVELTSDSALLVVDIQERLVSAIAEDQRDPLLKYARALIRLADEVDATLVYTEQYPEGLGATESDLLDELETADAESFQKTHFSACAAPGAGEWLDDLPRRVAVCGVEAHVCVWATVRSLLQSGHEVLVPFDAVASRTADHQSNGLSLIENAGGR
ncbi:MAG: isochorismatase family protein, partial [Bradymonadaceae bacterium]